jgi:5'-nucleotidase
MLTLVVDMDEVLANFVDPVISRWNAVYGTAHTRAGFNMWDMSKTLGPGAYQTVEHWLSEPSFFRNLQPLDGAVDGLNYFTEHNGFDIIIATSISSTVHNAYDAKRAWLAQWFPKLNLRNLIAVQRKEIVRGDILIDDAPHNISAWIDTNRSAIIMDRPWNQDLICHDVIASRAHNWDDVIDILDGE